MYFFRFPHVFQNVRQSQWEERAASPQSPHMGRPTSLPHLQVRTGLRLAFPTLVPCLLEPKLSRGPGVLQLCAPPLPSQRCAASFLCPRHKRTPLLDSDMCNVSVNNFSVIHILSYQQVDGMDGKLNKHYKGVPIAIGTRTPPAPALGVSKSVALRRIPRRAPVPRLISARSCAFGLQS